MHWPAVTADLRKIAAFHRASWVETRGLRMKQEGIIGK
jgi:hypothetical protein